MKIVVAHLLYEQGSPVRITRRAACTAAAPACAPSLSACGAGADTGAGRGSTDDCSASGKS